LDAKVRHLGTDRNVKILERIYEYTKDRIDIEFNSLVIDVEKTEKGFRIITDKKKEYECTDLILATGRSGSKWISSICDKFGIELKRNRVDIGVRVELPAEIFKHITDDVYESKIVYKTEKYNDMVRTFCMNPYGEVVAENTNGIVTVNGHSYADPALRTENTNFAIRGIDGNLGERDADTFSNDLHKTLKADYILANPPFNIKDWGANRLVDDVRWKYGMPPAGNANYAWIQHIISKLSPNGVAGFVMANGAMSTNTTSEAEIRKNIIGFPVCRSCCKICNN
jgi:hypothetical protein